MSLRRASVLFWIALIACATLLGLRAITGPFSFVHSPVNLEGITSAAFLLTLGLRSKVDADLGLPSRTTWASVGLYGLVATIALLAFVPSLTVPFVADDAFHVWNARHISWHSAWAYLAEPEKDRFFRPLVYWAYAGEAVLAGVNAVVWHACSLIWHLANTLLVYALLRRLRFAQFAAAVGALLFALNGTRPEAVTWVAALFDLMACCFGLAALVVLLSYAHQIRRGRYFGSLGLLLAALLCKESALVFPLLLALCLFYIGVGWRRVLRLASGWLLIALLVFAYRFAVIGGIGGYANASDGRPTVFNLRWSTTLKGLFLRAWGAVLFPINWTHRPEWWLAIALCLGLAASVWLAYQGGSRRAFVLGLVFFFVAALPVHQFLSIGGDLEKSRVLYLPSVGLAILSAALFATRRTFDWAAALGLILFQVAALEHNLREWKRVGDLAEKTCASVVARVDAGQYPLAIPDLPNTIDGVYFLKTGFPHCVWLARPQHEEDVTVTPVPGSLVLHWDPATRQLR